MKLVVSMVAALAATSAFANAPAATPASKGDPKAAETIVNQVCAGCHSVDGNSTAAANPSLAGLNSEYINKQLNDFKSGARKNAIMSGMVASLSQQDMLNLAAYFSAQQPKPGTSKDQQLALIGQKIYRGGVLGAGVPACASCHGPQGKGIPVPVPAPGRPAQRIHLHPAERFPARRARKRWRQDDAHHRCQDDGCRHEGRGLLYSGLAVTPDLPESIKG